MTKPPARRRRPDVRPGVTAGARGQGVKEQQTEREGYVARAQRAGEAAAGRDTHPGQTIVLFSRVWRMLTVTEEGPVLR